MPQADPTLRRQRRHLHFDALVGLVRRRFEQLPEPRRDPDFSLADTLMAGLALFSLKDPSLLAVRHDNRVNIADAVSRILGRRYLSRPTHLGSKDARDHSLLVKRWWATKCPDPRAARLAK